MSSIAARWSDALRHPAARTRTLRAIDRAARDAETAEGWAPVNLFVQVGDGRVDEVATAYVFDPDDATARVARALRVWADEIDPPVDPRLAEYTAVVAQATADMLDSLDDTEDDDQDDDQDDEDEVRTVADLDQDDADTIEEPTR
jgi:hypothetical protein